MLHSLIDIVTEPASLCSQKMQKFLVSAKSAALDLVETSPDKLQSLQTTYATHFSAPTLAAVQTEYAALDVATATNTKLIAAITTTLDVVDAILNDMAVLEQYVTLSLPRVEDGGNFGVTIQLGALKTLSETKEKLEKACDDVSKYYSSRADALEKCKLPSSSNTSTKTSTQSSSQGNTTEKGDQTSTETKTVTEDKESSTTNTPSAPEVACRTQAVVAVDVLYYQKAKSLFRSAVLGLTAALDYADKNAEKIAKPKGSSGGNGGFSSMY